MLLIRIFARFHKLQAIIRIFVRFYKLRVLVEFLAVFREKNFPFANIAKIFNPAKFTYDSPKYFKNK